MNGKPSEKKDSNDAVWLMPLKILAWPFMVIFRNLYKHWFAYLIGRVLRDRDRIYSIKFIWYGDSVYLHPMIWGSLILYLVSGNQAVNPGWLLLTWFILLAVCFLTVIYNFDIIKASMLALGVVAVLGLSYISATDWDWNPLKIVNDHITGLDTEVHSGFYVIAAYVFGLLIVNEVLWAWLFHRIEIDESYVYERRFLQGTTREPIFARGLKRETKDLLELLILGAADISHQTRGGYKRYKNVPAASLGLGTAIDSLLDHRRKGQIEMERDMDAADQATTEHATHDMDAEGADDGNH